MMKSTKILSSNDWCHECQPEPPTERRHYRAPLFAVPVLLAVLTIITLAWYGEPLHPNAVRSIKLSNEIRPYNSQEGMVMIHKGLSVSDEHLSGALLCRPDLFLGQISATALSKWTTKECFEAQDDGNMTPNVHVRSAASLMDNASDWVACASRYNQPDLLMTTSLRNDTFEPSCPSYPEPNAKEHAMLRVPLRNYDYNIFHMMVILGRPLWCVLDAVTRFAAQAKQKGTTWTVEFQVDPGMHDSRYAKNLFRALSNDTTIVNQNNVNTSYELQGNLSVDERTLVAKHGVFWPPTQFSEWLSDTSKRVRRQVLDPEGSNNGTSLFLLEKPKTPFVLLVLRSTKRRRLAGAETGTATEIVMALLKQSLPIYILDSAYATIEEQIGLFESATVVVSMHGAGLTNLIWMRPGESTVIEVAASYGWGRYIDKKGNCTTLEREPEQYKKGGYYNLARRFGIRYELVHPVYASRPAIWPQNPVGKWLYYVDANALADVTANAFHEANA